MNRCTRAALMVSLMAVIASAQQSIEVTNWKMQDSATVGAATGQTVSAASFDAASWYAATVPGTVLQTLVDQKVYPDPFYGLNMLSIPDLANQQKRYWFRGTFTVTFSAGQRVWLELGGINYHALIFVNGQQVGTMYGAFKEAKYDVTSLVTSGATNYIAVRIRGNYNPGTYHHKETGACGVNGGTMSQDGPTFIATQGWDWIPTIPDRSMGIWKPVYVRVTGPVVIRHPWIRTTNVSATSATVPLQVMLRNTTGAAVSGTVAANIDGTTQFTPQTVTIPANDTLNVTFPNLTLNTPRLWWPNGYGDPNLYTCNISFTPNGSPVSDSMTFKFGVRQFAFSTTTGSLIISCNGQRILVKGGNWGMDDAMKKWDVHKTENKVRYHKEMNLNMIRDWIGMTDNEPFYSFCDQYGIMVWSDFWQPHGVDGPNATDKTNFIANMQDKFYRVRNHASVALWCARNETTPTAEFLTALQNFHTDLDGTRYVHASSGSGGTHSGGPYQYTSPSWAINALSGFHTELGGPTPMSTESMQATIPAANLMPMNVQNDYWAFHDYCDGNGNSTTFTTAMNTLYGTPSTIQQCGLQSQLMNYDNYRAYLEALQVKRFNGATGLLLWMSNCVWPSTVWQTYDYYMEGTGAMYGCQKGAEPIHVMYYGSGSYQVSVVNNTRNALSGYSVSAATYNLNGTRAWQNSNNDVNVAADASANIFGITAGTSTPYFLDLKLKDGSGKLVSKNFYWIPNSGQNIGNMLTMGQAAVAMTTPEATWTKSGVENTITFKIVNTSAVCAVACRLQLTRATSGERILPVHYNDNYFSLIPSDTQEVTVKFDEIDRAGENPKLCLTGVNVPLTCFTIGGAAASRRSTPIAGDPMKTWFERKNKTIVLHNVPKNTQYRVTVFDLAGRSAFRSRGISGASNVTLNAPHLGNGTYIAMVEFAGRTIRSMLAASGR